MENASKALLIAGEILIAILILSLAVYLITSYSSTEEAYQEKMTTQQIEAYNVGFTKYIEYDSFGEMYISAQNLITIGNLASSIQDQNEGTAITTVEFSEKKNNEIEEELKASTDAMFKADAIKNKSYPIYYKISNTANDSIGRISTIKVVYSTTKYYKDGNIFTKET